MYTQLIATVVCMVTLNIRNAHGHGMMLDPVARSTMWRFGYSTERNYNDNWLFCGGKAVSSPIYGCTMNLYFTLILHILHRCKRPLRWAIELTRCYKVNGHICPYLIVGKELSFHENMDMSWYESKSYIQYHPSLSTSLV